MKSHEKSKKDSNIIRATTGLYIVPVNECYLLFSPLRRLYALINRKGIIELKKAIDNNWRCQKSSKILLQIINDIRKTQDELPAMKTGKIDPSFLGIIPTRACNGACVYCGFGTQNNTNQDVMGLDVATAAVDWMAEIVKANGKDILEIHFFGGEPFIAPDIIETVIHRARMIASQLKLFPHFEVSTNGQFDDHLARFIGDYFDTVVLSLDGTEEIQNKHRPMKANPDSYSLAAQNAKYLSRTQAELCLRACISDLNVRRMEEIAHYFCKTFEPSIINFEVLRPNSTSNSNVLNPPNPYEFAINCVRACRVVEHYGIKAVYASAQTDSTRMTFCPVGKDTAIVSPNGRISSCYLLESNWKARKLDLNIGQVNKNSVSIDMQSIENIRQMVQKKPRCLNCFCHWTCAGGCHVENTYPNCSNEYDNFCIQTRIITACSLLYNLNQEKRIELLLNNRTGMEALAMNDSDRLEDWGER